MISCADEKHAHRILQSNCPEQDITILRATPNRFKRQEEIILTSEELMKVKNSERYVHIGIFYSNGFTTIQSSRSPAIEVWNPIHKDILQFYISQGKSISMKNCFTGTRRPISPAFDAYYNDSTESEWCSIANKKKLVNLHLLVQARLDFLFSCHDTNSFGEQLEDGLSYILDVVHSQYVALDQLSFEAMIKTISHNKYDAVANYEPYISLWNEMEQKLITYRIMGSFLVHENGDLSVFFPSFIQKVNEDQYTFNKEDLQYLHKQDKQFLSNLLLDEDRNTLNKLETLVFILHICRSRIDELIRSTTISSSRTLGHFVHRPTVIDQLETHELSELNSKVYDLFISTFKEKVGTTLENKVKVYTNGTEKPVLTGLAPKRDVMPKCVSRLIEGKEQDVNSFVFSYFEAVDIDIEDIIKLKPEWARTLQRTKAYVQKPGNELFKPGCGWLMKNGLCPHLNIHNNINNKKKDTKEKDNEEKDNKKRKYIEVEVPKEDWVSTMRKCTSDRNYGMSALGGTFHKNPIEYTKTKQKHSQFYNKQIKSSINTASCSSSSSSSSS